MDKNNISQLLQRVIYPRNYIYALGCISVLHLREVPNVFEPVGRYDLTISFVGRNACLAGYKGLIEERTATRGVQQVVEEVGFVDIYNLSNCRSAQ